MNSKKGQINSHISSIIPEKEKPTKSSDKVVQVKTEDTRLQRTDEKKSKPDARPLHS